MRRATYRYALQPSTFSPDEGRGIDEALANWQAADANTGLATTFDLVGWSDTRELGFVRGPLPAGTGAAVVDPVYGADGYLNSAGILFTTDQQFAFSGELGVRKATRHEAGHLHALNDVDSGIAPGQSSVMLSPVATNDAGNLWPDAVTACDADMAYQAQFLPN